MERGIRDASKHRMTRRAPWHNYNMPGTYLLTLTVEGRKPVFGSLKEEPAPHIVLSELGKQIEEKELAKINHFYPNVSIWFYCIMPDHIHLILHVSSPFEGNKHLGNVVYGFKVGCSRAWWRTLSVEPRGKTRGIGGASNNAYNDKGNLSVLFSKGYHDGILFNDEQFEGWKNYLSDNPRRLAIKRNHPDYFVVLHNMAIYGKNCQIVGNRFLLDIPDKMAVIVHRRDDDAIYADKSRRWLECGERGGVLVSAAISKREKAIIKEAFNRGYSIILIRENGFPKLYKPAGRAFDACADGKLLQICPWEYHMERRDITRQQCLQLNALAEKIANG